MDGVLATLVEEIALEGEDGCSIEKMWELYHKHISTNSGTDNFDAFSDPFGESSNVEELDESLKGFYWEHLVAIPHLQFFQFNPNSNSVPKRKGKKRKSNDVDDDEVEVELDQNSDREIIPKSEIIAIPYLQLGEVYGEKLHVFASKEKRKQIVAGNNAPTFTDQVYKFLERVAKSRGEGILSSEISKEQHIDPRTIFYILKTLIPYGLVVKFSVIAKRVTSNHCLHTKFAHLNKNYLQYLQLQKRNAGDNTSDSGVNELKLGFRSGLAKADWHKITVTLKEAKNGVLVQSELLELMKPGRIITVAERRFYNRTIDNLAKDGYIERVLVPKRLGLEGFDKCVRFLKVYELNDVKISSTAKSLPGHTSASNSAEGIELLGEGGILLDLSLQRQIHRLIGLAGEEGTTVTILCRSLNNCNRRLMNGILDKLTQQSSSNTMFVYRCAEFVGKIRQYRYYSEAAYKAKFGNDMSASQMTSKSKSKKKQDKVEEVEVVSEEEEEEAVETESEDENVDVQPQTITEIEDSEPNTPSQRILRTRTSSKVINEETEKEEAAAVEELSLNDKDGDSDYDQTTCKACSKDDNDEKILLCDSCDNGYHTYCLNPPLDVIPEGDWFCSEECTGKGVRPRNSNAEEKAQSPIQIPSDHDSEFQAEDDDMDINEKKVDISSEEEEMSNDDEVDEEPETTPNSKEKVKNFITGPIKRYTINYIQRKNLMLEFLENERIIDISGGSGGFVSRFQETGRERGIINDKHKIDRKTLIRTAENLHEAKLLTFVTFSVPFLNGGVGSRHIIIHKSLNLDDPEVLRFRQNLDDRGFLSNNFPKFPTLEIRHDLEVERLSDVRKRTRREIAAPTSPDNDEMEFDAQNAEAPSSLAVHSVIPEPGEFWNADQSYIPESELNNASNEIIQEGSTEEESTNWSLKGIRYGYVPARFMRVRILHEYLLEKILSRSSENLIVQNGFIDGGVFQAADLLHRNFPVHIFLKVIGLFKDLKELDELMMTPNWETITVSQLDRNLFREFQGFGRKKGTLKRLLETLGALQLIEPCLAENDVYDPRKIYEKYILKFTVPLKDYNSEDRTLLRYYNLTSLETCREFWYTLEWNHVKPQPRTSLKDADDDEEEDDRLKSKRIHEPLKFISKLSNWRMTLQIPRQSRLMLEKYVDRSKKLTPLYNPDKILEISQRTKLNVAIIKQYFTKLEDHFQRLRLSKQRAEKGSTAQKEATRIALKKSRLHNRRATVQRKPHNILQMSTKQSVSSKKATNPNRYRINWTTELDRLFLFSFAIQKVRCATLPKLIWDPIANVIEDLKNSASVSAICRRRIKVLLQDPKKAHFLSKLVAEWPALYERGVAEGAFELYADGKITVVTYQTDISEMVKYFMQNINEDIIQSSTEPNIQQNQTLHLPKHIDQIYSTYDIVMTENPAFKPRIEIFDASIQRTMTSKMDLLNMASLTIEADEVNINRTPMNEYNIMKQVVKNLHKMLFITPDDEYRPEQAFAMLNYYPTEIVVNALNSLKEDKTLNVSTNSKRGPGSKALFSEKFMSQFFGKYYGRMNLHRQAQNTRNSFMALDSGEYNVNSKCTDETAIVALDLMADDQVTALPRVGDRVFSSFDVAPKFDVVLRLKRRQSGNIEGSSNGDDLMEPTQTSIRRKRKDSSDKVEFAKRPRTTQSQHLDPSDPAIEIIDQTRNSTEKLVLHRIYEFIDQKGVSGVSLKDIHPNFPDLESDSLQNAIKKLNSTVLNASDPDVSVINRVGFSSHRFVTHKWIKTWTLGPVVSSASISSSDSRVDTRFGKARLWYDIRGKVVDWILHVSLRSVLSYIVMFPGIKMSVLQTQLTSAFCKAEAIELVEMLIEKKLVREKRLTIPKRPTSIWDDDAFDAGIHDIGNSNGFQDDAGIFLFPVVNFYHSLS